MPIHETEIRPGFVDTAMAKGEGKFWVATVRKAANQIFNSIKRKKSIVCVTKRWRAVAITLRLLQRQLYKQL